MFPLRFIPSFKSLAEVLAELSKSQILSQAIKYMCKTKSNQKVFSRNVPIDPLKITHTPVIVVRFLVHPQNLEIHNLEETKPRETKPRGDKT